MARKRNAGNELWQANGGQTNCRGIKNGKDGNDEMVDGEELQRGVLEWSGVQTGRMQLRSTGTWRSAEKTQRGTI
jgi:hypothetical protein